jgi:hypothetical protein
MSLFADGMRVPMLLSVLAFSGVAAAQSGRGTMHGYVAFDDVAYSDLAQKKVRAQVELRGSTEYNREVTYRTETDEHGAYDFNSVAMGEYVLRISSPGHATYETQLYIPSDFACRLATMLKRAAPGKVSNLKRAPSRFR